MDCEQRGVKAANASVPLLPLKICSLSFLHVDADLTWSQLSTAMTHTCCNMCYSILLYSFRSAQ